MKTKKSRANTTTHRGKLAVQAIAQGTWDDLILQHGVAGTHHHLDVLVGLGDGLKHDYIVIEAAEDGRTVGLLPLIHMRSILFGDFLVSLPYLNWAGVIAKDADITQLILDEAIRLADQLEVRFLELRQENSIEHPQLIFPDTKKVQMRLLLPSTEEDAWTNIRSSVRSQVRKGEKQDFRIEFGGIELLDDFYHVFSVNMRDLGTPVYARSFFSSILSNLRGRSELCVVYLGKVPIACSLVVCLGGVMEVPSASALRAHRKTAVNSWMYWQLIRRAIQQGENIFDFGRSSEDGPTYDFKKKWGAKPEPCPWQQYNRHGDPEQMRPDSPKYSLAIKIWQKLPVWLTRIIGPSIVRGIP